VKLQIGENIPGRTVQIW